MNDLKVLHLSYSDTTGGAARAAYRIHEAMLHSGFGSRMLVASLTSDDWTVKYPSGNFRKGLLRSRLTLNGALRASLSANNPLVLAPSLLPSPVLDEVNSSDADLVHIHWVHGGMLSVKDIGRISKPIVWTLHDMWAFCGDEHYSESDRWRHGYTKKNRPKGDVGFDINKWVWGQKRKIWKRPFQIVAPSRWMADCVRESRLMRDWPVSTIENCIDASKWRPLPKDVARDLLNLPRDVPLVMFGAINGGYDPRKGFDLLISALAELSNIEPDVQLVVFGQSKPCNPISLNYPLHYVGHVYDELTLRALYSAADVFVIPSRQDNLPNTALEAQVCGTPVVGFNVGGLPDAVQHKLTGYLSDPFDIGDLAQGIRWALQVRNVGGVVNSVRSHAEEKFNYDIISRKYAEVYFSACSHQITPNA